MVFSLLCVKEKFIDLGWVFCICVCFNVCVFSFVVVWVDFIKLLIVEVLVVFVLFCSRVFIILELIMMCLLLLVMLILVVVFIIFGGKVEVLLLVLKLLFLVLEMLLLFVFEVLFWVRGFVLELRVGIVVCFVILFLSRLFFCGIGLDSSY